MMGVWIRSAGNTVDAPEASAAVPFTIAIPPGSISVALAANKASPQAPGSTITWTASASGGVAPLQYKWFVFDGVNWAIVQDWSPANTFAWTPSSPNANHYVGVWVKSATNPADTFEAWAAVPFTIQ
jgi:hypothetical protein